MSMSWPSLVESLLRRRDWPATAEVLARQSEHSGRLEAVRGVIEPLLNDRSAREQVMRELSQVPRWPHALTAAWLAAYAGEESGAIVDAYRRLQSGTAREPDAGSPGESDPGQIPADTVAVD